MKHFLTILILISLQIQVPAIAMEVNLDNLEKGECVITRDKGYYMDGRGQVPEYARIAPPHEENIPVPHPTKTVVGWDRYYDINKEGYRPMGYQTPLVPGHNVVYSERRAKPYSTSDYLAVWCNGEADYRKGTCTTANKVYYYYDVHHWSAAVAATPFRDLKRTKDGKGRGYVMYCHELGLCAEYMHAAKDWSELFDMDIHFVTIDAYIGKDWLL
mgnify:CR=1 FL=1